MLFCVLCGAPGTAEPHFVDTRGVTFCTEFGPRGVQTVAKEVKIRQKTSTSQNHLEHLSRWFENGPICNRIIGPKKSNRSYIECRKEHSRKQWRMHTWYAQLICYFDAFDILPVWVYAISLSAISQNPPNCKSPGISGTNMFAAAFAASRYARNNEKWNLLSWLDRNWNWLMPWVLYKCWGLLTPNVLKILA